MITRGNPPSCTATLRFQELGSTGVYPVMTTTTALPGTKKPAFSRGGWHYDAVTFPAGQHTPGDVTPAQVADVYARHTYYFALDLDLYVLLKRTVWGTSMLKKYTGARPPYVVRGLEGSMRYLVYVPDPDAWWPVSSPMGWGEIRASGIAPSPESQHPSGDAYNLVPGPHKLIRPNGKVLMTNVLTLDDELKAALIADGARGRDDRVTVPLDVDIPQHDEIICPTATDWLNGQNFTGASATGERAHAAAVYLKRMAHEGHYVATAIEEARAELPETTDADWASMWAGVTVDPQAGYTALNDACGSTQLHGVLAPVPAPSPGVPVLTTAEAPAEGDEGGLNLPETFWTASPRLRHLRMFAHAHYAPADAVLYSALARLAAARKWSLALDTRMLSAASLNTLVAICDSSGGGKTAAVRIAAKAVEFTAPDGGLKEIPEGSGEGIAEAYMGVEEEPTGEVTPAGAPKVRKVRRQVRHNVLAYVDEGAGLMQLMERSGSTLGATLRAAWNGSVIGQANGRQETTRSVEDYAFSMIVGFQPAAIGPLIDETHLGTAQRFLFCKATDPSIPDTAPVNPGPLRITWPCTVRYDYDKDGTAIAGTAWAQEQGLTLEPSVAAEIRARYLERQRGEATVAPGMEHYNLLRAKVAALLLILDSADGSDHVVTRKYWDLAGIMLATSLRVKEHMRDLYGRISAAQNIQLGEAMGQRELGKRGTVGQFDQTAAKIREKARQGAAPSVIWRNLSKRQKAYFPDVEAVRNVAEAS